jgi:hypothetical protein
VTKKLIRFPQPWEALDPALAELLAPELPGLADEISAVIGSTIAEYRRPMQGLFGETVRTAIVEALHRFLAQMGGPAPDPRPGLQIYVDLGRGELRSGRRLDALQEAYRIGARLSWRRLGNAAREAGVDPEQLSLLAEAIFGYIDELSAASIEGYAREQAAAAGERQGRRQSLVRLLIDGAAAGEEAEQAARAAGWELPRSLAALACDYFDAERLAVRIGLGSIAAPHDGCCCVLLPDPDGPGVREQLAAGLKRTTAALGPTVAWAEAARSFERARACLRLQAVGTLPAGGLLIAEQRLGELVLHRDEELLAELVAVRLAPLDGLTPAARERLEQTLHEWLRCQGSVTEIAAALHVHPQTVRYRLARLRERFGEALDDPEARFELELATRARLTPRADLLYSH